MSTVFPDRAYLICCDARTGSTLLASTLRATDRAGKPYEYFGRAEIDKPWMRTELHVPDDEPFTTFSAWGDYILRAGAERGGVFGASIHWFQARDFVATFAGADTPALQVMRRVFPDLRLIRLRRRNIVAQAISHYVAIVTNVWNSTSARDKKPGEMDLGAAYDFDRIDWQVKSAVVADEGWRETLKGAEAITLSLTYEDLASEFDRSLRRVLRHIGVAEEPAPSTYLEKQAGAWSLELERRYRAERETRGMGPVGDEGELAG